MKRLAADTANASEVLAVLDRIERWFAKDLNARALSWPCPRCKAGAGEFCRQPGGAELRRKKSLGAGHRHHAARQDHCIRVCNSLMPRAWHTDLECYRVPPRKVLAEIQQSYGYRQLVKADVL